MSRRAFSPSPLPDAVGELGARRLERWVSLAFVAVVLLGLLAAGLLLHLGALGLTAAPPPAAADPEAPPVAAAGVPPGPSGAETILTGARP